MNPVAKDVRIDPLLTNVSIGRRAEGTIAEQIFPIIKVQKDAAKIATYTDDNLRLNKSLRAPGAPANEVDFRVTIGDHYSLDDHALKEEIPDELRENAMSPIQPDRDSTENLTDKLVLEKEKALADVLRDPTIITQTATPAVQWSTLATSDPIGDVRTAKTAIRNGSGKKANTLLLSEDVFQTLLVHSDIIARFPGATVVTEEMVKNQLGAIFGLKNVHIGEAQYNSANEGQTSVLTDIWTKDALVLYVEKNPTQKSRSIGKTYQKAKKFRKVMKWRDSDPSTEKDWVSVSDKYDQKLIDATCAYLIDDAIA